MRVDKRSFWFIKQINLKRECLTLYSDIMKKAAFLIALMFGIQLGFCQQTDTLKVAKDTIPVAAVDTVKAVAQPVASAPTAATSPIYKLSGFIFASLAGIESIKDKTYDGSLGALSRNGITAIKGSSMKNVLLLFDIFVCCTIIKGILEETTSESFEYIGLRFSCFFVSAINSALLR